MAQDKFFEYSELDFIQAGEGVKGSIAQGDDGEANRVPSQVGKNTLFLKQRMDVLAHASHPTITTSTPGSFTANRNVNIAKAGTYSMPDGAAIGSVVNLKAHVDGVVITTTTEFVAHQYTSLNLKKNQSAQFVKTASGWDDVNLHGTFSERLGHTQLNRTVELVTMTDGTSYDNKPTGWTRKINKAGSAGVPPDLSDYAHLTCIASRSEGESSWLLIDASKSSTKMWFGFKSSVGEVPVWNRFYNDNQKPTPYELGAARKNGDTSQNFAARQLILPTSTGTIGGSDITKGRIYLGGPSKGLGIDDNEIYTKGDHLIIGVVDPEYSVVIRNGSTDNIASFRDSQISFHKTLYVEDKKAYTVNSQGGFNKLREYEDSYWRAANNTLYFNQSTTSARAIVANTSTMYLNYEQGFSNGISVSGKFLVPDLVIGAHGSVKGQLSKVIMQDHGNGNVTLSATNGNLYLGYQNTEKVFLATDLYNGDGTIKIIDKVTARVYDEGNRVYSPTNKPTYQDMSLDDRYIQYDYLGGATYPRLKPVSGPWLRVGDGSMTSGGLLPYSKDGNTTIGTSTWRFYSAYINNIFEGDVNIADKYLRKDSVDDDFDNAIVSKQRHGGLFGNYKSTLIDHIWGMGTSYRIGTDGLSFGNFYGAAYKYNDVGGSVHAGGHQFVWVQNGQPHVALGNNIWAKNDIISDSDMVFTDYLKRGSKRVIGGTSDDWVRVNPAGDYAAGMLVKGDIRTEDGKITYRGFTSDDSTKMGGSTDTSWGNNGTAAFSHRRGDSSSAHWLIASYIDAVNIRAGIQVLSRESGVMRFYTNGRTKHIAMEAGNVYLESPSIQSTDERSLICRGWALNNLLGINAKAVDSDKLDGLNSTQFLRSDVDDTFTASSLEFSSGDLKFLGSGNGVGWNSNGGSSAIRFESSPTASDLLDFRITNTGGELFRWTGVTSGADVTWATLRDDLFSLPSQDLKVVRTGAKSNHLISSTSENVVTLDSGVNTDSTLYITEYNGLHGTFIKYQGSDSNVSKFGVRSEGADFVAFEIARSSTPYVNFLKVPKVNGTLLARVTDKVADSDKLDGIQGSQFLRRDASGTVTEGTYYNLEIYSGLKRSDPNSTGAANVLLVRDYVELNAGRSDKDVLLGWADTGNIRVCVDLVGRDGSTKIADANGKTYDEGVALTTKYARRNGEADQDFQGKVVTAKEKVVVGTDIEIRKNADGSLGFYL
ncbi:hypothetical protein [Vibrio phage Va2]|nr:hypothetical protein [Vibrio phage Va2]